MFNEDDIFSIPSFDMQSCYDDSMPLTYDDIDESGFEEVKTLTSDVPTLLDNNDFNYDSYHFIDCICNPR